MACPSDPVLSHSLPLCKTHDWRDSIPRSLPVLSTSSFFISFSSVFNSLINAFFEGSVRSVVLGVAMGYILSELARRLCRLLHARIHLEGLLINISTGFVPMNSGNRYSGRSTNPGAFMLWQQLPRHREVVYEKGVF